jgi:hypothetical protein
VPRPRYRLRANGHRADVSASPGGSSWSRETQTPDAPRCDASLRVTAVCGSCSIGGPTGSGIPELAVRTGELLGQPTYTPRHAAYDLRKLRGKGLVERVGTTRRYQPTTPAIGRLVALLILREKVIKPVLAGAGKPKPGRPPKRIFSATKLPPDFAGA